MNLSKGRKYQSAAGLAALSIAAFGLPAIAQQDGTASSSEAAEDEAAVLNTVFVTARGREESLQDIPESIIALDRFDLEARGITDIEGVVNQTPNFFVRETFRAGVTFFTIRGVSTGQQGWAPITYVVDGVKSATLDSINQGALFDIERVEVLKGPQGGLYGAGAIAGAINVVTQKPTDQFEAGIVGSYAEGDDFVLKGAVSGPIVEDKILFKLSGYLRDKEGLTETQEGDGIDFEEQASVRGRLLFTPNDSLEVDLRAAFTDITAGAARQSRFDTPDQVNTFNDSLDPSRGILGEENREITDLSAQINLDLPFGTLTSTTGYLDLEQDLFGSVSWIAPPALGEAPVFGIFGPVLGPNAGPTDTFDQFQSLFDNFEVFTQDVRIVSPSDQSFRWLVGVEHINREASQGLAVGVLQGPQGATEFPFLNRFDDKEDSIWGVFAQAQFDLSDRLELTLSGRYDENEFSTRQFDGASGLLVQQTDVNGVLVDELSETDSAFQPKITLAYELNDNINTYATYARGFRFGFFNTGNLTQQEMTDNFEIGARSSWLGGDLNLNGSVFYIDYSDQQVTAALATPPFRITTNVPETEIYGIEADFDWRMNDSFSTNGSIGYLDAERTDGGGEVPVTPKWTMNFGAEYTQDLNASKELFGRFDYRYQGEHIAIDGGGLVYDIDSANLIDLRGGIRGDKWRLAAFVKNAADEQTALDPNSFGTFLIRDYTPPRSVGVELGVDF